MGNGPSQEHNDVERPDNSPSDEEYETTVSYESEGKYEGTNDRAFDILVTSPVDDVSELIYRTHLTAQFHKSNQKYWEDKTELNNSGGSLYDYAIQNVFEIKLEKEGIDPTDVDIPTKYLRALFLREARCQNSKQLFEHLDGTIDIDNAIFGEKEIDFFSWKLPSYDTFQRKVRKFRDNDEIEMASFNDAVSRAVFAVYRAGIVPPDAVKKKYRFSEVEPPLDEKRVSREAKQQELRHWVRLLMDETTEPLTFARESANVVHGMQRFIGAFASSVLFDAGLANIKDVSDWNYPREKIPGGSWPENYITKRLDYSEDLDPFQQTTAGTAVPTIDEQFTQVHNRLLSLADDLGYWSDNDPLNIGIDLFTVDWRGDSLDMTIGRPPKAEDEGVTELWSFVIAAGIKNNSRFILNGRLVPDQSENPAIIDEFLSESSQIVDLDTIVHDAGLASGELIDTFRRQTRDNWIVSAPDKGQIKGIERLTPKDSVGFAKGVKWNTDPDPNLITYPHSDEEDGDEPESLEIISEAVLGEEVRDEDDDRIGIPYDTEEAKKVKEQSSLTHDAPSIPYLTDRYPDLEKQPGVGSDNTHAAYLTDLTLPEASAREIRSIYPSRWGIETTINQIKNDFMPRIQSKDHKQRLYGLHIAIMFYNWHTLINRTVSPLGLRLDVTYQELLQAIRDVAFSDVEVEDHPWE